MALEFEPSSVLFWATLSGQRLVQITNPTDSRFAVSVTPSDDVFTVNPDCEFIEAQGNITVIVNRNGGPWKDSTLSISIAEVSMTEFNASRVFQRRGVQKSLHKLDLKLTPKGYCKQTMSSASKMKNPTPNSTTTKVDTTKTVGGVLNNLKKTSEVAEKLKSNVQKSSKVLKKRSNVATKDNESLMKHDSDGTLIPPKKLKQDPEVSGGSTSQIVQFTGESKEEEGGSGGEPRAHENTPPRIVGFFGVKVEHRGEVYTLGGSMSNEWMKGSSMPTPGGQWADTTDPKVVWCRYCRRNHSRTNKSRHVCRTTAASTLAILGQEPSTSSVPAISEVDEE